MHMNFVSRIKHFQIHLVPTLNIPTHFSIIWDIILSFPKLYINTKVWRINRLRVTYHYQQVGIMELSVRQSIKINKKQTT